MRKKVLIVACELPPLPGLPVRGGGLRIWGLGEGLKAHGHDVRFALPKAAVPAGVDLPADLAALLYEPETLNETVLAAAPDVIVVEQWGLATYLDDLKIPLAIDLHGPLSLENAFKEESNFLSDALTKIDALAKADLLICPGEYQRQYFLGWFLMAGAAPRQAPLVVVPVGFPPTPPARREPENLRFVFGGVTWPWIDPFPGLEMLARRVAADENATLDLFVGAPAMNYQHPLYAINKNIFHDYRERLADLARVTFHDLAPREQLLDFYAGASVAFDLYRPNAERQLAVTTRTVEYLWCGLPPLYGDYGELAAPLRLYDAGWVVDPADESAIAAALDEIFRDPAAVRRKSENARRLAAERFAWDRAAAPLARFVAQPTIREKKATLVAGFRDYFRKESVHQILAAKEQVGKLSDALREAAVQADADRRERDKRHEELSLDFKKSQQDNDERLQRQADLHRAELGRKEDDLRRQQEKLEREIARRDDENERRRAEQKAAIEAAYAEVQRLNDDKEAQRAAHEEAIRGLVARHEATMLDRQGEIERQSGLVEQLARERDALKATMAGKLAEIERAVAEKERYVETAERRLGELEAETSTLRKRAALQERRLADFEDDENLKKRARRDFRLARLLRQAPRLAWLFAVNLGANIYMKIYEKRKGIKIFPGT